MSNLSPQYQTILGVFLIVTVIMIIIGFVIKRLNSIKITSTLQNIIEIIFEIFENMVNSILGERYVKTFTPLAMTIFITIFLTNIAGLIALSEGAKFNPFYTFTWSISMFFVWNIYGIYIIGIKAFVKDFFTPFAFMFPLEFIQFLVKPMSMALRLFGNITAGAIFMMLFWKIPGVIISISTLIGGILTPVFIGFGAALSLYFSLFSPFIQATVFTFLTLVNVGVLIEEEE